MQELLPNKLFYSGEIIMFTVIKPPNKLPESFKNTIFLAGSIEMGTAVYWQNAVVEHFKDLDVTILNPRRDDWNSSWKQNINNDQFREQVEWELTALERATHIIMYFDPLTKAPITLLELGLFSRGDPFKRLIVCCPGEYWRKGNVDIVCKRYGVQMVETLHDAVQEVKRHLK